MNESTSRALVGQLSEDISWLEDHCRQQKETALQAGQLRLAAALVRNAIGPYLDGQSPIPLHVTVVGGASSGKSTVVNLLTGSAAAEANAQAGFTRHPVCYTNANGAIAWPAHLGFLGPLVRLTDPVPSSLDQDVYQVRRVDSDSASASLLENFVIWDCPDMTTWAAAGYIPRLLEVCGLTDVLVYVASDERYNDAIPTQFLQMLLEAGKPVICTLTKMRAADAEAFLEHFRSEVLKGMPGSALNCMAIPFFTAQELATPTTGRVAEYRIKLLNQVSVLGYPPPLARARTVRLASNYLALHADHLLSVARDDLNALESWNSAVEAGRTEFESRYRQEYLATEKFRRFDEALIRLIELLELPGVGKVVSNTLWVVRTPFRLVKGWVQQNLQRQESANQPELPVLEAGLKGWLDFLRKEALQRSDSHAVWAHIEKGFDNNLLPNQAKEKFQQGYRAFQLGLANEVERTARSIYEELEKNPVLLNTLRGSKLALDAASIGGVVLAGGLSVWDVVLIPLAASVSQYLVEYLGAQYVEQQREETRSRQEMLMKENLSQPLGEWLTNWPSTGGSTYERLHQALKRIPGNLQELNEMVTSALNQSGVAT
jgi:hypothetical protein